MGLTQAETIQKQRQRWVCWIYLLSGMIGLAYQVLWYRVATDHFGATNLTFALVVISFIGGLGVGSLASGTLARWLGFKPGGNAWLRTYGVIELLIAAAVALRSFNGGVFDSMWGHFPYSPHDGIYGQTLVYQMGKTLALMSMIFIPCFFMGATFPLLCGAFPRDARFPSRLYGWNTLGACIGILLCEFIFLRTLGYRNSLLMLVGINAALGMGCWIFGKRMEKKDEERGDGIDKEKDMGKDNDFGGDGEEGLNPSAVLILAAIGGAICGALECDQLQHIRFAGYRQAAAMSIVSFWAIIAIFAASWVVRACRGLTLAHIKIGLFAALGIYWVTERHTLVLRDMLWNSTWVKGEIGMELIFMGAMVFPSYFYASLLLPWLCNRVQARGRWVGGAYGVNTVAFCLGLLIFSAVTTRVNVFYSFKTAIGFFAILVVTAALIPLRGKVDWRRPALGLAALAVLALAAPRGFDKSYFAPDNGAALYPVRALKADGQHTTFVVADPTGDRLFFDSHSMSGTAPDARQYMRLMAHFPLLAQQDPKRALLICFGVGNTASAIALHDSIERIDVVDLNERVFETAPEFRKWNHDVIDDPRLRKIHDDGRNWLNITDEKYDLVTSEPPPPMQAGVYRLYSREYYDSVLRHLTPAGMMTQWLPYEQLSQDGVDLIMRTFAQSFPHSMMYVGAGTNIILLGSPSPIDLPLLERRLDASPKIKGDLSQLILAGAPELLARVVEGERGMKSQYGTGPAISDQRNDLLYLVFNWKRGVVPYAPARVAAELAGMKLQSRDRLKQILSSRDQLLGAVPDFRKEMLPAH